MRKTFLLNRENPEMRKNMRYFLIFGTAFKIVLLALFLAGCAKEVDKNQPVADNQLAANIVGTFPSNLADTAYINSVVTVTFKSTTNPADVTASMITLKQGTTSVQGTVSYSGTTAMFTPADDLMPDTRYTATIKSKLKSDSDGSEQSWSFTTGKHRHENVLSIVSVLPLNSATLVPVSVQPSATFSSSIELSKIKKLLFTLKQGKTNVEGTLIYSGKTVTFIPKSSLNVNTLYTVTISSGDNSGHNNEGEDDKEEKDNHHSDKTYTWSFMTGGGSVDVTAPAIKSAVPANNATGIALSVHPEVTFSEAMNATTINTTNFLLKQGTVVIVGTVTYFGTTATFLPTTSLMPNTVYTASITTGAKDLAGNAIASIYTWSFKTGAVVDGTPPTVLSSVPASNTTGVVNSIHPSVTFSEAMNATTINTTTFTLKQGTTAVAGTVAYSGTTATFTPASSLVANTVYTASITTGAKDVAGNSIASAYAWSFTTALAVDVTPPTVLSSVPSSNTTGVVNSIHPLVTFSEAMNATTINTTTFTLKQGTTAVAGTVAYSGTTATFTPASSLVANTVYTASITTGAKDVAGNAIASPYTWSFTTAVAADVTAPTVLSVVPASGATSVAANSNITAAFSEAMNTSTITSTTFTLKQGTISVAGLVTYSGTTATFNPAGDLTGNTVYTATITTGAKDLAGNAIATSKVWSFTTVATATVVSFATQVMPILQSKCAPCHGANSPTAGISITNFTTVSKLSNTQLDNANMYTKMGVTPAEQAIIKAWIAAGRPNN